MLLYRGRNNCFFGTKYKFNLTYLFFYSSLVKLDTKQSIIIYRLVGINAAISLVNAYEI